MLLKRNDKVIFVLPDSQLKYTVELQHLRNAETGAVDNDAIFEYLQLDKLEFTSEAYGYPIEGGVWPECHFQDYEALSRCVEKLAEYCQDVLVNGKSIKPSVFVHKPKITLKFN